MLFKDHLLSHGISNFQCQVSLGCGLWTGCRRFSGAVEALLSLHGSVISSKQRWTQTARRHRKLCGCKLKQKPLIWDISQGICSSHPSPLAPNGGGEDSERENPCSEPSKSWSVFLFAVFFTKWVLDLRSLYYVVISVLLEATFLSTLSYFVVKSSDSWHELYWRSSQGVLLKLL